jgi:hypothetical protein
MVQETPMSKLIKLMPFLAVAVSLSACGHNVEQKAATGAIAGAVVAGPVGAAVGGAAGAVAGKAEEHNNDNPHR